MNPAGKRYGQVLITLTLILQLDDTAAALIVIARDYSRFDKNTGYKETGYKETVQVIVIVTVTVAVNKTVTVTVTVADTVTVAGLIQAARRLYR